MKTYNDKEVICSYEELFDLYLAIDVAYATLCQYLEEDDPILEGLYDKREEMEKKYNF